MRLTGRLFLFILGAVFALLFSMHTVYAALPPSDIEPLSQQGQAAAIASGSANVRAGPGTGFWIVGVLNPAETVPILAISPDGGWWLINARFGIGWVATNVVVASNTGGVPTQDPGPIVTITATQLNVRGGPGEAALVLGRIYFGNQLFLLGRSADGTWLNVRSQFGENTWVAARFTSVGDAAAPANSTTNLPVTEAETFAFVNTGSLNIRAGPGVNYAIIGTVLGGERLPIIGRNADRSWYNVRTVFGDGWVSARFVIARNEFGNAPITTAAVDPATLTGPTAIINTGSLNIRSGDSAAYTILGVARGGDQFQIVARNASFTWILIRTANFDGWVNRRFVLIQGDTTGLSVASASTPLTVTDPSTGITTTTSATLTGPIAFVATGAINIRSGPNIAFESLGIVYSTTRMPIIGQSADRRWWQVESPFGIGWVNKNYIRVEGDASNVPVA
jgi:uncharacterized protein YraI